MNLDSQIMVTIFGIGCFTIGVILGARLNSIAQNKPRRAKQKKDTQETPQKGD